MHPSLCFLCLPGRALCLNRLFKNAKWTPSAAAGAGDGPIVRGIDLFLSDYAGFLTALVDHGHQMGRLQDLRPVLAVEGDQIVIGEDLEDPQTQIVFNTNEDTKFTKAGEEIGLEDIKAGDIINVVHSLAMTKSLPPQTYAYEIEVVDAEEGVLPETMELEGTIVEVEEGRVTIGDETDPNAQTILLVSEETEILDEDGNALELEDLAKGMEIKAVHKNMMTMSIPPQTPTLSITVIG